MMAGPGVLLVGGIFGIDTGFDGQFYLPKKDSDTVDDVMSVTLAIGSLLPLAA